MIPAEPLQKSHGLWLLIVWNFDTFLEVTSHQNIFRWFSSWFPTHFQLVSNSFPTRFQLYFQVEYRNSRRHPRQSYRNLMGYDYWGCGLCEIFRRFWKSHPIKIFSDGFPADFQLISNSSNSRIRLGNELEDHLEAGRGEPSYVWPPTDCRSP